MASIDIQPLDKDVPFGAKVSGVTRENLQEEETRQQLRDLFQEVGVIVFKNVEQTPEMQVDISTVFGPLKDHPVPTVDRADSEKLLGVIAISNNPGACIVEIDGKPLVTWQPWHFDHAYNNELNYAGVLRSIITAKDGGDTAFADGIQIYNDMDPEIRKKAEGVSLLLNLDLRYGRQRFGLPEGFRVIKEHENSMSAENENGRCAVHPAVWTRETGEKVFHMTPYGCRGIVGDRSDAAFELLQEIWDEAMDVMKPYYHKWEDGDMVIWDNHRVLHHATGCNPDNERLVHRTTIKGDYGLGRWEDEPARETVTA
jgi:taurine dioxygenase